MAETLLVRVKAIDEFSGTFSKMDDHTSKWSKGTAIAGIAAAAGIGVTVAALGACVKEAMEAEKVTAETNAILKTTGGVANISGGEIEKLSGTLMRKTAVDDEVIQSGMNMMLTFKNVRNAAGEGNDIFNQSSDLMLDMAQKMGMDVPSAAKQLGKALEDPEKGAVALRRAGVQLSEQQMTSIKTFMEHGDIVSAQKIVLGELRGQMGLVSEAYGATTEGRLKTIGLLFGDLKEKIGEKFLPILIKMADWVITNWPGICNTLGRIGDVFKTIYDVIVGTLSTVADKMIGAVEWIKGAWGSIVDFFQSVWNRLAAVFWEGVHTAEQIIKTLLDAASHLPFVGGKFGEMRDKVKESMDASGRKVAEFAQAEDDTRGKTVEYVNKMIDAYKGLGTEVKTKFSDLYNSLIQTQNSSNPQIQEKARQGMQSVVSQIVEQMPLARGSAEKLTQGIVDAIAQGDLKGASARKIQEVAESIAYTSGVPIAQVQKLLSDMHTTISATNFSGASAQAGNTIAQGLDAQSGSVQNTVNNIGATVANTVGGWFFSTPPLKVQGADNLNDVWQGIAQWFRDHPINLFGKVTTGHSGGQVMHTGGAVPSFQTGGRMTLTGKERPAILEVGEYVVRKEAVKKVGVQTLNAINRGNVGAPSQKNVTVNLSAGAFMGNPGDARRFAREVQKYLDAEAKR